MFTSLTILASVIMFKDLIFLPDVNILDSFTCKAQSLIPTCQRLKRAPLTTCSVPVSMQNGAWLDSKQPSWSWELAVWCLKGIRFIHFCVLVARQSQHPFLWNINRVGATLLRFLSIIFME